MIMHCCETHQQVGINNNDVHYLECGCYVLKCSVNLSKCGGVDCIMNTVISIWWVQEDTPDATTHKLIRAYCLH